MMLRQRQWIVALLSMTLVALEVIWTRVFSAEYFYTFAFLIVSLAVLGLGFGALALRLVPWFGPTAGVGTPLALASLVALAGPGAVLRLHLDFGAIFRDPWIAPRLVLALVILAAPFFLAGITLARLFREQHREMPRLYMADLAGAAGGVLLAVWSMNAVGTWLAAVLVCVPLAAASLVADGRPRAVHAALAALVVVLAVFARPVLELPRKEPGPVLLSSWDAMGKLKVHDLAPDHRNIQIDNAANSPVHRFDGDWTGVKPGQYEFLFELQAIMQPRPGFVAASLGSGGGSEVLQALLAGAREVHAIEVNPAVNRLMTGGALSAFSGRIYADPRVKVITEDGRAYLRRHPGAFDVIISSSSNSFAALASGTFALSEDYLFTTEALRDEYRALAPGGFFLMEHQFYVPKVVSSALDALEALGVGDPRRHIAVFDLPKHRRKVIVLSQAPMDEELPGKVLGPLNAETAEYLTLEYAPAAPDRDNLVSRIIRGGWRAEAPTAPFDIRPCTDDRPFVAQMGLWRNVTLGTLGKARLYEFQGFPISKLVVTAILIVCGLLAVPLLFLPRVLGRGPGLGAAAWIYFFAIGAGFMAVETVLLQQFSLLVGSSAWTIVVVLFVLLVACGAGSRFAARVPQAVPFRGIVLWVILDIALFHRIVSAVGGFGPWPRMAIAAVLLAPLGFFMGMPFPKAALLVGERIDWGFAVNGVASVLGSSGILLVAMQYGFRAALLVASAFYAAAWLLLASPGLWSLARQGREDAGSAPLPSDPPAARGLMDA